jgi:hypothetical protein
MASRTFASIGILSLGLSATAAAASPAPTSNFVPDPASVQRYGPGYRYPQAGWIVLHIEGGPYERGYQHGRLLAPEIADYVKAMAQRHSPKAPGDAWHSLRTMVNALFLRRYDPEYLEEMKGIADGAAAAGAKFEGRALDLIDIVAVNSEIEAAFLEPALEATAHGLEGRSFQDPLCPVEPKVQPPEHCSAFAATGPATADGKVVLGHITMFSLYFVRHFNVWLDVKPSKGHRVLMQTYPGGIQSGMDYYLNDAGLIVAETTLAQTKFDINGRALASRIRQALQYADSIDQAVAILKAANNGLYTNEWLLADTKTNEIAMFELGTHKSKLWRSSRNEWLAGTEGFYWGCNNAKDLDVRLETVAAVEGKPANVVFRPSDRDQKWIELYQAHKGKINAEFGFLAFATPPLAAAHSCDAKFTTAAMARDLKTYALFGPPRGRTWEPTPAERQHLADIRPLVPNDWTILRGDAVSPTSNGSAATEAVDLAAAAADSHDQATHGHEPSPLAPAWHGTLLPASDADIWLATAFAEYESIVSHEKMIKSRAKDGRLGPDDRDHMALALFAPRCRYRTAVQRRGGDIPLRKIQADWARNEWYDIAAGKGVLLLAALRSLMGDGPFETLMDEFGRAHAGRTASTAEFRQQAEQAYGKPLDNFFATWLDREGLPNGDRGGFWSVESFEVEPARALIVYGTLKEQAAQREAAEALQRIVAQKWYNLLIPIKADTDVTEADRKNHHLLLIGRPETNAVLARCAPALPLTFGCGSFVLRGQTYAHASSAVIAAGSNPWSERYSVVAFAGLSADATWHCVRALENNGAPAEVVLLANGKRAKRLVVPADQRPTPGLFSAAAAR